MVRPVVDRAVGEPVVDGAVCMWQRVVHVALACRHVTHYYEYDAVLTRRLSHNGRNCNVLPRHRPCELAEWHPPDVGWCHCMPGI
jgi:hypothetical protein